MRVPSDRWQILTLLVLTPFLAELVSGSTPPIQWILPPVFLAFVALYGVSSLVIRELAIRVGGGGATVLILGLAFGVVNEGLSVHSLFNPAWPGVAVLGTYGHWGGVSWLWAEWIVPFHAVWSISFPIFLFGQIWPSTRTRRLLTNRRTYALVLVPIVTALAVSALFPTYPIPWSDYAGMFGAISVFGYLGLRWGPRINSLARSGRWVPSPRLAAVAGVLFFVVGQIGTWDTPLLGPFPELGFGLILLAYLGLAALALTFVRSPRGEVDRFAFVVGGIGFYTLLSPIAEFGGGRIGLIPIDLIVLALAIRLYYRRTAGTRVPSPAPPPQPTTGPPPTGTGPPREEPGPPTPIGAGGRPPAEETPPVARSSGSADGAGRFI